MFHVVVECSGLPTSFNTQVIDDIKDEFTRRPWQQSVGLTWKDGWLRLEADNDFDNNGLSTLDKVSDVIVACVEDAQYSDMRVVTVTTS